jgi:Glycosyl hydrolase family 79 C-terminal beta domain
LIGVIAHRYPYAACARPGAPTVPTIARVLSENATAGMARTAVKVEHISDRARLPLWLTEINSVTCGGTRGVSNTFATALWAPDALLELVQAGVESASVHIRADAINMAFSLTPHGLIAHPLFYGMVLFARTLGPGARLVPVHLAAPAALHLKAWAVRIDGGLVHILLIDKGPRPARLRLRLPLTGAATVQRLTAPDVTATAHVSFAGRRLGRAGTWVGAPHTETVTPGSSGYVVSLPRYSAALITARLQPGALGP